ncbi:hypothetical protein BCR33DRAFT_737560 [Rhizoclosmatium globosum]|uniref:Uncharacterized protein n=1 Tax=Rhizoclosmatium globosum TaxID=329046 RepID=A0A1Y2CDR4_9FUNG|nr:hypothetical protein BCR33DRAFT_737560 [Rhizoclosmatium globosum]|eukprot:ORY45179.1 hypothetical protein BCR33DRAFT_737560 [Rhizoclosmatium globosum]
MSGIVYGLKLNSHQQYTHRDDEELPFPFTAYRSLPRPQSASKQNGSDRKRWSLSWSNSNDSPSKSTTSQNEFETFIAAAPAATVNSRRPSARNSIDYDNIVDLATQGNPTAVQILHLQQKQDQLIQALDRDVNQPPTLERKKPSNRAPSVKFVDNQRGSVETQELISIAAKARLEAVEKEWTRRQELQAVQKASSLRRRGEMAPVHQPTHRRMSLSTIDLETLLLKASGSPHHSVNTKNRSLKRQSSDFAISYHNNGTTGNGMRRQASKASVRSVSWNIMGRRTDSGKDNDEDTTDEEDEVSSDDSDDSEEVKDNQPLHSSPSTTSMKSSLKRRVSSQSLFAQQHQMLMQPQPVMYPQMTYAPPLIPPSPPQHPRLQKKRSVDSRLSNTMGSRGSKTPSWTSTSDSTTTPMRNSSYSSLVMLQQQQMMMQQQLYQQQMMMQQQFIPPPPVVPATPYQYHQFAPILQTGPVNMMPYAQVLATPPVTGDSINDLKPLQQLAREDKVRRKIV